MTDKGFIVVSDAGEYFCGLNIFDNQLRKAKIYHSERYANQTVNDSRFKNMNLHIEKVVIRTVNWSDDDTESPTTDVQEVKHGNWLIHRFGDDARCSKCGRVSFGAYNFESCDRFCRNCGAKMEGVEVIDNELY